MPADTPLLDQEFALKQFSGNKNFLVKILQKFFDQYADFQNLLNSTLSSEGTDPARALVHTLKGVSGNLGLQRLHQSSRELETSLKNGEQDSALQAQFADILASTLEAVTSFLNESQSPAQVQQEETEQSRDKLRSMLARNEFIAPARLDELLQQINLSDSKKAQLREAIQTLEYDQASAILN